MSQPSSQVHQHPASVDAYIRANWSLVPIPPGTKGPRTPGWNKRENALKSQDDLPQGYGIGLGHAYSGTMALDIDNWEVAAFVLGLQGIDIRALYDAPDAVVIDSGKVGRGKLLYKLSEPLRTKKIVTNSETAYELRCATASGLTVQDVLPPSIHPDTGSPYRWAGRGHWTRLPLLPQQLLEHWQSLLAKDDERTITETHGDIAVSWSEVSEALHCINADCSREDWTHIGMALQWAGHHSNRVDDALNLWDEWSQGSEKKYPGKREILTQWKSFKADKETGVKLGTLFKIAYEHGYQRPQPDVTALFSEVNKAPEELMTMLRPPAPSFDLSLFPEVLARRAQEVSTGVGCDPLVPLLAGLSAVCAVVDSRTRLEITQGFKVPPVLWLMTIGEPGDKKSPGSRPMMGVLRDLELEDRDRFAASMHAWEALEARYAAEKKAFLEAAGSSEHLLGAELPHVSELPAAPVPVKLTVNDITSQKLVRVVADRPRGVLCYLDEMNSWVKKMTDKSSGEDRSTWVVGYEAESYSMDRVGSGTTYADTFAVSIYGNIQPLIFKQAFENLGGDGMLQRFIPAVLRKHKWGIGQPVPDFLSNKTQYEQMLRLVYALPPTQYKLSTEAYVLFKEFQQWYEDFKWDERVVGSDDYYINAIGKLEGTLNRLALIFHVMECPFTQEVSASVMERCIEFVKGYLIPAYRFVFASGEYSGSEGLDYWMTEYVITYADQVSLTLSQVKKSARRQVVGRTDYQAEQMIITSMSVLEGVGWVKRQDEGKVVTWYINPQLKVQFEKQRQIVLEAKQRQLDRIYTLSTKEKPVIRQYTQT